MIGLLLGIASCGSERPAARSNLEISVDDVTALIEVTDTIPLTSIVWAPSPTWREVRATTDDGRALTLTTPAITYPGSEVRLYLDARRVALGVFPPVTPDMPADVARLARQPIESLVGINKLQISTRRRELPSLVVEVDGKPTVLRTAELETLPIVGTRRQGSEGWSVKDVLAKIDAGRSWRHVRAVGEDGTLDVDLGSPALYVLKPNSRGDYVFRVWEPERKTPTRELRKLIKISID